MNKIPSIFHFVFGMSETTDKPWSYCHHLAIQLCIAVNQPEEIFLWFAHEPQGYWWEKTKPLVSLRRMDAPQTIYGRKLCHLAHQADVVRLQKLIEFGGYYLDADCWALQPFRELSSCGTWLGIQAGRGLCNATIGAAPNSPFLGLWLDEYRSFRSVGRDQFWDEHSVRIPARLAKENPDLLTVFPSTHFFNPLWHHIKDIFETDKPKHLEKSLSVHLWEQFSWEWLKDLTPETMNPASEIGEICKKYQLCN